MTTTCVFHHRQLHAGVIGVKGKAPFDLGVNMATYIRKQYKKYGPKPPGG